MSSPQAETFTTGLVLGAGGSRRLGQPKQLLPYGERTLLDHTVQTARESGFDQLVVPIGGAADEVRERVDLSGADVVVNYDYGEGCSSSIAAALETVDARCEVLVLMLGDQPGVTPAIVRALHRRARGRAACGLPIRRRTRASVCLRSSYLSPARRSARRQRCMASAGSVRRGGRRGTDRGQRAARRGHARGLSGRARGGRLYGGDGMSRLQRSDELEEEMRRLIPSVDKLGQMLGDVDYLADEGLATSAYLALRLPQPLLLEGEAGVGKTELAKALAAVMDTPADPPAVLRGHRRLRGAVRVELSAPAAEHPHRRLQGRGSRRGGPVRSRLPHPPPAAARAGAQGPAPGRPADRRARPR